MPKVKNYGIIVSALDKINEFRTSIGLGIIDKFPKGAGRSTCCPIAKVLYNDYNVKCNIIVTEDTIVFKTDYHARLAARLWRTEVTALKSASMPVELKKFVIAFDNGELPSLLDNEGKRLLKEKELKGAKKLKSTTIEKSGTTDKPKKGKKDKVPSKKERLSDTEKLSVRKKLEELTGQPAVRNSNLNIGTRIKKLKKTEGAIKPVEKIESSKSKTQQNEEWIGRHSKELLIAVLQLLQCPALSKPEDQLTDVDIKAKTYTKELMYKISSEQTNLQ